METHSGQGGPATHELGFPPSSSPFSKSTFIISGSKSIIGSELNAIGDIHQLELIALPRLIASLNLGSLWSLLVPQTGFTEACRPSSNTKAPRKPTRDKYQSSSPSLLLEKTTLIPWRTGRSRATDRHFAEAESPVRLRSAE